MKLLLLHGPAINSSRAKLSNFKSKFDTNNIVVFDEESDPQMISGYLMTPTLLAEEQLIIVENPPEDFAPDSSLITHHSSLVIWFDHEVGEKKPVMEWAKINGLILYFPEAKEVSVFPFLDYLAAGDKKAFLEMDKLKEASFDVHYLIVMVFYLLRNLVVTSQNAPTFVKQKLERQRKNFTTSGIIKLYKEILALDFKLKSGLLEQEQAEFLLVDRFLNSSI